MNAVSSPQPRYKLVSFTRDMSLASGSQAVTGVGFTPRAIEIFGGVNASTPAKQFRGATDGVSQGAVCDMNAASYVDGSNFIMIGVDGSNLQRGSLSSMDSDGFTVSWTKTGTPTGTATIYALCKI